MAQSDYFGITNPEDLNPRQINNLLIEIRRKRKAKTEEPTISKREERANARELRAIANDNRRLDRVKDVKERIERSNKLAELAARKQDAYARNIKNVENALKKSNDRRLKRDEILTDQSREKTEALKQRYEEATTFGNEIHNRLQAESEKAQNRLTERDALPKEFFKRLEEKQEKQAVTARQKKKDFLFRQAFIRQRAAENKALGNKGLASPESFGEEVQKRKEIAARDGKARSDTAKTLAGLPEEKYKEHLGEIEQRLGKRHEKYHLLEEKAHQLFQDHTNKLKSLVEDAYEKGDSRREDKEARVAHMRHLTGEARQSLHRRLRNLFRNLISLTEVANQEAINAEILQGSIKALPFEISPLRLMEPDQLFIPQPHKASAQIFMQESPNSSMIFEQYLEKLITQNQSQAGNTTNFEFPDNTLLSANNQPIPSKQNPKLPEASSSEEQQLRTPDNEKLSKNKNDWGFKDIVTFIDDTEAREGEKAAALEDVLKQNLATRQEQASETQSEDANRLAAAKQRVKSERELALQEYYRKLIEEQNKTAHQRAVELGQFINLFF